MHLLKFYVLGSRQLIDTRNLQRFSRFLQNRTGSKPFSNLESGRLFTVIVISETFKSVDKPFVVILNDKEEAAYYLNDIERLLGNKRVLFYPGSYRRPYQTEETDNANILLRSEVLTHINAKKKPGVIVTYPDALFEKVITKGARANHF